MADKKLGCLFWLAKLFNLSGQAKEFPYIRRDKLLSDGEFRFLNVLEKAVRPGHRVFCQVRLEDIIQVKRTKDRSERATSRNKIKNRHMDFLVCDSDTKILCAIELNDKTHERSDRIKRDQFYIDLFEKVGLRLVMVKIQRTYRIDDLKSKIYASAD